MPIHRLHSSYLTKYLLPPRRSHYSFVSNMKKLKKALRLFGLVFLIVLALMGVGGISIFSTREKYQDNEIRIEVVDKKEEESDTDLKDVS